MTSLSTLHSNTPHTYLHSVESNIPLFILNGGNRSPSSLHSNTTTAVTFRRTIIFLSAAEDFGFDANQLRSEHCLLFKFFLFFWWTVVLFSMAFWEALAVIYIKEKKLSRWCFTLLSQGQTPLDLLGIPGRAETLYQAEQVCCKVGTRGQSVSRWIPNVTVHPNPERRGNTLKPESPEKVEGWVGKKNPSWLYFKEFYKLLEIMLTAAGVPAVFCIRQ